MVHIRPAADKRDGAPPHQLGMGRMMLTAERAATVRDAVIKAHPLGVPAKFQAVFQIALFTMFIVMGWGALESRALNRLSALLTIPNNFFLNFATGNVFIISSSMATADDVLSLRHSRSTRTTSSPRWAGRRASWWR